MSPPTAQADTSAPDSQITPSTSIGYWSSRPPTVNTMLGGYPQISRTDLRGSATFYAKLLRLHPHSSSSSTHTPATEPSQDSTSSEVSPSSPEVVAVDCGAGIGRVTSGFLCKVCTVLDAVEPVPSFASEIPGQLARSGTQTCKIGTIYTQGLADWTPTPERYDLIWNQWCTLYLTDDEFVAYLRRCAVGIRKGTGWIVVKENTTRAEQETAGDVYDPEDSSLTRTTGKFLDIFARAGLDVVVQEEQKGFPKGLGLFPVKMFALRPGTR